MALSGLDSALSGLRVAQQQMNVISNNVANVSTPGYTRKILPQSAVSAEGTTIGVRGDSIVRSVDMNLTRDFWTQVSSTSFYEVQATYLNKIQQFHGPPDAEISIAAKLSDLRDLFLALSNTPDDSFLIQSVVGKAQDLSNKINEFSDLITQMRNDAQDEIQQSVGRVNDLLEQIADINKQVKINTSVGKTTAALEDARDNAIKELSAELEVSFFVRGDGVMVVQTNNGVQLADERAETMFFDPIPVGPDSVYLGPGDPNNTSSGLYVGGDPDTNPAAFDITGLSPNGNIGGLLELRDTILPEHTAQLDELAHKLATRFADQGIYLFTDGSGQIPSDSPAILTGNADLSLVAGGGDLSGAIADPNDVFHIILDPSGTAPQTLVIDLSDVALANPVPPAANGGQALVDYINTQISSLPAPYNNTNATLQTNALGTPNVLELTSPADIRITNNVTDGMSNADLQTLGLSVLTTTAAPKSSPFEPPPYVGFASEMRINPAVINNNTLIRESTLGLNVQDGSNEFIRRITDYVFGTSSFQMAQGTIDLRVSGNPPASDTLHEAFGFSAFSTLIGDVDMRALGSGGDLLNAPDNPFAVSGTIFTIDFSDGSGPVDIDLAASDALAAPPAPTNGGERLVEYLNTVIIPGLTPPYDTDVNASLNSFGQLVITSIDDITVGTNTMNDSGLSFLGLERGTTPATNPYFEIQIGQDDPIQISIAAGDTEIDLVNKINTNVSGAVASINATTGTLSIRPGPDFGGDIRLNAGSIFSDSGLTTLEEFFGIPNPVINVAHPDFHESNLGPGANLNSKITGANNLVSYAQKMISAQSEMANLNEARLNDEITFRDVLSRQLLDESGVNIEEELSNLIIVQTAFSAAARTVQAIDEMFQDLINNVR
jgi:flagellar hook-associated protein 1 FlgK